MDQMIEFDVLLNVGFNENLRYLYLIMWLMSVVGSYDLIMYSLLLSSVETTEICLSGWRFEGSS